MITILTYLNNGLKYLEKDWLVIRTRINNDINSSWWYPEELLVLISK
jgi:hypothetical protein